MTSTENFQLKRSRFSVLQILCTLIPGIKICKYLKNANYFDKIQNISNIETESGLSVDPKLREILILIDNSLFLCLSLTNKSESVKGVSTRYNVKMELIDLNKFAKVRYEQNLIYVGFEVASTVEMKSYLLAYNGV
jgi:hypothetical protein